MQGVFKWRTHQKPVHNPQLLQAHGAHAWHVVQTDYACQVVHKQMESYTQSAGRTACTAIHHRLLPTSPQCVGYNGLVAGRLIGLNG
eukprot:354386-Chlamydomonas_euryale.AAC.4